MTHDSMSGKMGKLKVTSAEGPERIRGAIRYGCPLSRSTSRR